MSKKRNLQEPFQNLETKWNLSGKLLEKKPNIYIWEQKLATMYFEKTPKKECKNFYKLDLSQCTP